MRPEDVPEEWMEIGVGAMFDAMAESVGASERWADAPTGAPTPELNRWRLGMRAAIAAVAPLIAAREREACAEISFDEYLAASHDDEDPQNHDLVARFRSQGGADSANRIYAAIRARGGEG